MELGLPHRYFQLGDSPNSQLLLGTTLSEDNFGRHQWFALSFTCLSRAAFEAAPPGLSRAGSPRANKVFLVAREELYHN